MISITRGRCNDDARICAADVWRADCHHVDRLSGRVLAGSAGSGQWLFCCLHGLVPPIFHDRAATQCVWYLVERPAAGDTFFHPHGHHSGALWSRRRHARLDGADVWYCQGRPRLFCHHRWLHPGGYYRHRRRSGDRHGHDFPAGDDALEIQHALCHRRVGRIRHYHATRATFPGAYRPGRPTRKVSRRHVQGRLGSVYFAGAVVCRLHLPPDSPAPRRATGCTQGIARTQWLAAVPKMPEGNCAFCRTDLHCFGQHGWAARHQCCRGYANRGWRDGCDGCIFIGLDEQTPDLESHLAGHGRHHATDRYGGLYPDRFTRVLACVPRCGRRHLDRAHAVWPARRSDRLSDRREHLRVLPGVFS